MVCMLAFCACAKSDEAREWGKGLGQGNEVRKWGKGLGPRLWVMHTRTRGGGQTAGAESRERSSRGACPQQALIID
eukprot:364435-Chlamydomonas_euryale.AAC.12